MIKLPPFQFSVIVGLLLSGKLIMRKFSDNKPFLVFTDCIDNIENYWYEFFILSHYCKGVPRFTSGIRANNRYFGISFETRSLLCFTGLYKMFYKNNIKCIPDNIYELLMPMALAH